MKVSKLNKSICWDKAPTSHKQIWNKNRINKIMSSMEIHQNSELLYSRSTSTSLRMILISTSNEKYSAKEVCEKYSEDNEYIGTKLNTWLHMQIISCERDHNKSFNNTLISIEVETMFFCI